MADLSHKEMRASWWCAMALNAASIVACCVVLAFTGFIYRNPDTRSSLRRQSLVMLLAALIMSIFFNLGNLLSYVYPEGSGLCAITVIVMLLAGNFQHFIIMLIAVNLQLTVVHGISTVGHTPWYIGGAGLFSLITVIPGAAAHIWGYDPFVEACWMVISDRYQRVYWSVGTAHLWTLLSATIALFSAVAVLVKLKVMSNKVKNAFSDGVNVMSRQKIMASVTIRILPHPIYFVVSNVISVVIDLHVSLRYKDQFQDGPIIILYSFFYSTPALFFACVVLFFDPSFSTAIRRLFRTIPTALGLSHSTERNADAVPLPQIAVSMGATSPGHYAQSDMDVELGPQKSTNKHPIPELLDSQGDEPSPDSKPRLDLGTALRVNLASPQGGLQAQPDDLPGKHKDVDLDAL